MQEEARTRGREEARTRLERRKRKKTSGFLIPKPRSGDRLVENAQTHHNLSRVAATVW
jgi:hypothetical protein